MDLFFLVVLVAMLGLALGMGFPVAFAFPGSAVATIALAALGGYVLSGDVNAFFVHGSPLEWLSAGVTNFRGVYWLLEDDTLIAIPLFVFMGVMLQRSKVAEDLLVTMAQLFAKLRGGLGISVVVVGALLAATTGIVGATVIAMGMISLPTMLRHHYSRPLAAGLIAASGSLGQIIPPSIVLLILVDRLTAAVNIASTERRALYKAATGAFSMPSSLDVISVSPGEMFIGALLPGLLLVGLYVIYVAGVGLVQPRLAPAVPFEGAYDRKFALRVLLAMVPPLALILMVLGSIIMGVATVNQAGAIGAAGATVMAGWRLHEGRRGAFVPAFVAVAAVIAIALIVNLFHVNLRKIETPFDVLGVILAAVASAGLAFALGWSGWRTLKSGNILRGVVEQTTKTTCLVFAILLGAVMLTAAFRGFGGEDLVKGFLGTLPGGFWSQFAVVMAIIFALGFFLDFIEISAVVVPIVAPSLLADPAANVTAVWLGVMIGLNLQTSFLTPPFGFALFYLRGVAPAEVRTIDIYKGVVPLIAVQLLALGIVGVWPGLVNYLPNRALLLSDAAPPTTSPRLQRCMEDHVSREFARRGDAIRAAISQARQLDFSRLPAKVRQHWRQSLDGAANAFALMDDIATTRQAVEKAEPGYRDLHLRVRALQADARRIAIQMAGLDPSSERVASLTRARDRLLAQIPEEWAVAHASFTALQTAEATARRAWQHNADEAYHSVSELLAMIADATRLQALLPDLRTLRSLAAAGQVQQAADAIKPLRSMLNTIAGVESVSAAVNQANRALRAASPEPEAAQVFLAKAIALAQAEVDWRQSAAGDLAAGIEVYKGAIADTIGLRSQSHFPKSVALDVAWCNAAPRDVSLEF